MFSAVPAVPPSATKEHAAATRASCAATTVADDTDIGVSIAGVESAVKNAQTLKIAGDTLCILCASINRYVRSSLSSTFTTSLVSSKSFLHVTFSRSHIEQVLQVSVSLGRPPSTTATPATATKALLMTSPALGASSPRALPGRAAGCEGAGGGEAQPVETAVIDKTVPSATAATAIAAATVASGSTPAAKVSALPPTAGLRASLDAIVRKLMECADLYVCDLAGDSSTAPGTHQLNQAASVLYALQNVSSGVRALATVVSASTCSTPGGTTQQRENTSHNSSAYVSYENSASVTHSAAAIAGLQVAGRSRTRSHTRVPGFSKGLFASPAKTFVRASVGAGGPGASSSSRSGAQPVETQGLLLSCEKVFTYFHKLKSALSCVVQTSDRASLLKVKNNVFATLLDLCDLSVEHDLQQLCHDWQSCTVALAQALFDELAATAVAAPLGDDHLNDTVSQAPKYQSTQLETFSLLFSAPTQASQLMYAHHQHVNISVNSYSKRSPHRSNLPSQSSQPLYMRLHPNHHPQQQQDGEFPSGSAPPMEPYASQIVLCSAHPPAVQATVDLCGIIIKV